MPSSTIIAIGVCSLVGCIVFIVIFMVKFYKRGADKEGDKMISIIQTTEAGLARIVSTGPKQMTPAQLEASKRAKNFRQRAKTETRKPSSATSAVAPSDNARGEVGSQGSPSHVAVVSSRRNTMEKEMSLAMPEFIQKIRSRSISKDQAYDLVLPQFCDPETGDVKLMDKQDHSMDSKLEDDDDLEVIHC